MDLKKFYFMFLISLSEMLGSMSKAIGKKAEKVNGGEYSNGRGNGEE